MVVNQGIYNRHYMAVNDRLPWGVPLDSLP